MKINPLKIILPTLLFFIWCGQASAATLSKAPSNLGLVGYWSFDEGRGTQVGDGSGNGNNGNMTNMETTDWVVGKRGGALDFDGSNEYVSLSNIDSNKFSSSVTVSAWVNLSVDCVSVTDDFPNVINISDDIGFYCYKSLGKMAFFVDASPGGSRHQNTISDNLIPGGSWFHLVGTYDGSVQKFYINGVLQSNTESWSGTIKNTTGSSIIGGTGTTAFNWQGKIDEARIYSRALGATEVAALYNSGRARISGSSADLDNGTTLEQGLVGHWTMDGVDTNWGSNSMVDRSGNGNTGTLTNMSTTSSPAIGKVGQALNFDGVNDYINMGNVSSLKPTSAVSVAAWVNTADCTSSNKSIFSSGASASRGINLTTDSFCRLRMAIDGTFSFWSSAISLNQWYFVVAVWDGSASSFYVDGVLRDSDSVGSITYSTESVQIGTNNFGTQLWKGKIDEVRIYNRALSANEIKQLYNLGQNKINANQNKTGGTLDQGLVGLWSFNGADINWGSNTALDRSGNGNNGTITNMSTTSSPAIGKIGQALSFDGVNDYVNVQDVSLSGTFTISYWYKATTYEQVGVFIGEDSGTTGATPKIGLNNLAIPNKFFIRIVSTSDNTIDLGTVGQWHQAVITRDSSDKVDLYVDGGSANRLFSNVAQTGTFTVDKIGANGSEISQYLRGQMDDVRIYNRALSADEVKQLYRMGR